MVKRVFWVALGATVGVLVVTKGAKTLRKFTPSGLADSASGATGALGGALRGFAEDVRSAATDREFELYRALGVDAPDTGE